MGKKNWPVWMKSRLEKTGEPLGKTDATSINIWAAFYRMITSAQCARIEEPPFGAETADIFFGFLQVLFILQEQQ